MGFTYQKGQRALSIVFSMASVLLTSGFALAAPPQKVRLPKDSAFIVTDDNGKSIYCGRVNGEYSSGRLKGDYFEPYSNKIDSLKYKIRKAKKSGDSARAAELKRQLKTAQKVARPKNKLCVGGPGHDSSDGASMDTYDTPVTREDVRYLLEKAGFGLSAKEEALVTLGMSQGIGALVDEFIAPHDEQDGLLARVLDRRDTQIGMDTTQSPPGQRQAILDLLVHTNNPFSEKLALFLLSVWTVSGDVIGDETFRFVWWDYYARLREAALGEVNLPDVGVAIARDPLMLIYLNNELNRKGNPNENFARELMELFTLGPENLDSEPNYTETRPDGSGDMAVAARMLTGWTVKLNYQIPALQPEFRSDYHDSGPHVMFEGTPFQFTGENDEDLVRGIFQHHPGVKYYYAREILKEYVNPAPSRGLIENFAAVIQEHEFKLRPAMAVLLKSKAFYSAAHRNTVPKHPLEFAVELVRTMELADGINFSESDQQIQAMGMAINNPPSVFWYNNDAWTSPAILLEKSNFLAKILSDQTAQHNMDPDWNPSNLLPSGAASTDAVINSLASRLGVLSITDAQRTNLTSYMNLARQYNGTFTAQPYDNTNAAHQRQKGMGVFYILSGMPDSQLK